MLSRSRSPCALVLSSSSVPTPYLFHGPPPTAPRTSKQTFPRSLFPVRFPWIPTAPLSPLLRCFHSSSPRSSQEIPSSLSLCILVCTYPRRNILNRPWALYLPPVVFRLVVWVAPVVRSTLRVFRSPQCLVNSLHNNNVISIMSQMQMIIIRFSLQTCI